MRAVALNGAYRLPREAAYICLTFFHKRVKLFENEDRQSLL